MQADKAQEKPENLTVIIMRGVPGSGKSTKAKKLAGDKGLIFSTDDFFMQDGKYIFDPSMIGKNHEKNQKRTEQAMKECKELIVVDNTNVKLWEMKPYVQMADKHGYEVRVEESDTEWAKNANKCGKMNAHGVPTDKIKIMIDGFEAFNSIDDIRSSKQARRNGGGNRNK